MSLVRLNSIRASTFLTWSLIVLAISPSLYSYQGSYPCFHPLQASFLCLSLSRNSLLIYERPPGISAWLPLYWDVSLLSLEEVTLNINQVSLSPLPSRTLSHGTILRKSSKSSKSVILKCRIMSLLCALFIALNPTTLWSLKPRIPWVSYSPISPPCLWE